ncbi:unnamed protein product [Prunus armeniaca]
MLRGCISLIKLPVGMKELINLHHLDVSGTKIEEVPVQMGKLKSLRTLTAFVVGKSTGSGIRELREFPQLQGKLSILKLQNVVDARDARHANMKHKKDLKELEFSWGAEDADDSQKEKDVLNKLLPCVNLEKLTIRFYGGTNFPNWLGDSSFSNIQVMHLSDCSYCWSLPPVGRLPALKELCIERMKFVKTISVEFYGKNGGYLTQPFQSLEKLEFREMPEWEEWVPSGSASGRNCPTLSSFPKDGLATTLTWLSIHNCRRLEFLRHGMLAKLTSLDYLGILNSCDSMRFFPLGIFPKLTKVQIWDCENLESLSLEEERAVENLSHLNYLDVRRCPDLVCFYEGELPTPNLSHFEVGECENLKSLPERLHTLTALRDLWIWSLLNLESFAEDGGLPPNLRHLSIGNCERLRASSVGEYWGLQALVSLEQFSISGSDHVLEMLLKEQLLPTTLHTLSISSTLKSLDGKGLGRLTSLQVLEIGLCPSLEFLPEEGLPPFLSHLRIFFCPALEKRCKNKTGQDWAKISHIPSIAIGNEVIIKYELVHISLSTLNSQIKLRSSMCLFFF